MDGGSSAAWRELLMQLGIDPSSAVAGFAGGVVNALQMKIPKPLTIVSKAATGTLIAIYLGDLIAKAVNWPAPAIDFLVGYGGIELLQFLFTKLFSLVTKRFGNGDEDGGKRDVV